MFVFLPVYLLSAFDSAPLFFLVLSLCLLFCLYLRFAGLYNLDLAPTIIQNIHSKWKKSTSRSTLRLYSLPRTMVSPPFLFKLILSFKFLFPFCGLSVSLVLFIFFLYFPGLDIFGIIWLYFT